MENITASEIKLFEIHFKESHTPKLCKTCIYSDASVNSCNETYTEKPCDVYEIQLNKFIKNLRKKS